jgi:hypothetical protein
MFAGCQGVPRRWRSCGRAFSTPRGKRASRGRFISTSADASTDGMPGCTRNASRRPSRSTTTASQPQLARVIVTSSRGNARSAPTGTPMTKDRAVTANSLRVAVSAAARIQ